MFPNDPEPPADNCSDELARAYEMYLYAGDRTVAEISPISDSLFQKLLLTKPVSDWEKMTSFLVTRHLIRMPKGLPGSVPDLQMPKFMADRLKELEGEKKEKRAKAHALRLSEQKAAAIKRKEARATRHQAKMDADKAKAEARKEARSKNEASRVAAVKRRRDVARDVTPQLNPRDAFVGVKTAADTKVRLETIISSELKALSGHDGACVEKAIMDLPPVLFVRRDYRPVRPVLPPPTWSRSENEAADDKIAADRAYRRVQDAIRSADRHLTYLLHEDWRVVRKAGKK